MKHKQSNSTLQTIQNLLAFQITNLQNRKIQIIFYLQTGKIILQILDRYRYFQLLYCLQKIKKEKKSKIIYFMKQEKKQIKGINSGLEGTNTALNRKQIYPKFNKITQKDNCIIRINCKKDS
ncbi:hypothetical protein TTHERM_002653321 (macronuclear) [Tetrahymena thermophila SB210]|uniref:Uncharacterized protein n=1 Tax=Tetrahymena thermophila (strain SB210) TaxID=312017 RepID=W7X1W4_TETTS|nr:hypothetical protein TTHERM_002653321 [Tetrahymena thermophila SB210]EWS71627.1 hypothetical protein TTHERM_002653321 [Tetrahymena thermophila SB210]|eukprot:XP_012655838.1 hypothetical protein TTHERM_002653321 [Tetrahymena thermophila SB210]